jgi:hypothetical protein
VFPAGGLAELLGSSETVREENTFMAGAIRILVIRDKVVVQEQTPDTADVIVRACSSRDEADRFVDERLSAYERMWDGCGCKIDYSS